MSVSVVKFMGFHLSFITLLSVFIRGHNIWEKLQRSSFYYRFIRTHGDRGTKHFYIRICERTPWMRQPTHGSGSNKKLKENFISDN